MGGKPTGVDMGGAKPTHVQLGGKPTEVSVGGKPTSVGFGMVAKPSAVGMGASRAQGAGQPGGFDIGKMAAMFEEDGDGSPLDDILDKLMRS